MNCPSCQYANPSDAHFCANCSVQVVAHTGENALPEAIRNDAEALATVNQCSWP